MTNILHSIDLNRKSYKRRIIISFSILALITVPINKHASNAIMINGLSVMWLFYGVIAIMVFTYVGFLYQSLKQKKHPIIISQSGVQFNGKNEEQFVSWREVDQAIYVREGSSHQSYSIRLIYGDKEIKWGIGNLELHPNDVITLFEEHIPEEKWNLTY